MANLYVDIGILSCESHTTKYGFELIKNSSKFCWGLHWGRDFALTVKLMLGTVFCKVATQEKKDLSINCCSNSH